MRHAARAAFLALFAATAGCAGLDTDQETDGPEPVGEAGFALTVGQAINNSCSTTSVKGLSQQIIDQGQCINPAAFTALPAQPNLSLGAAVYPYLEEPARDALVAALKAKPGTTMTINSMLRTVAQQYLLYRWYKNGQCGIGLAATPGNSNHETGLALDVSQYATWQTTLEGKGFKWFGANDTVHYDYVGAGAQSYKGLDVLAFQMLWNKNHANDIIDEDGVYGPQTEARLDQSPADGFPIGPSCGQAKNTPDVYPTIALTNGEDRFSDASSAGINDVFEGDTYSVELDITNKGGAPASNVDIGIFIEDPYLAAADYFIESDWMNGGAFKENDANTDPANPKHKEPLGTTFTLKMNALSPNETKRVTLTLLATAYSIGLADSPDVRLWVKDIPGYYHQDDFNGAAQNTDASQTFGEKLQVYLPLDVYSRTHWEWDTDRLEGFSPSGAATLALDPSTMVLLLGGEGDDPGALGPATSFSADERTALMLRAKRTGGEGSAKIYFSTEDEPTMDEAKSFDFDLPDDEEFHEVVIVAGKNPHWKGTITGLRVDPFEKGPGSAELDYLRAVSADVGEGNGEGGSGGAPAANNGLPGSDASCSCATPGGGPAALSPGLAALIAAAALASRRSKRRQT